MASKRKKPITGLTGLASDLPEVNVVALLADLSAKADRLERLRVSLTSIAFSTPPKRDELIKLLSTLQAEIVPLTEVVHSLPDNAEWVESHPSIAALGFLRDGLADLDLGVTPDFLRAPRIGGPMKPQGEQALAAWLVGWVKSIEGIRGISRKAACREVAKAIPKMKLRIGKKPIDAKRLEGWCAGRRPGVKR